MSSTNEDKKPSPIGAANLQVLRDAAAEVVKQCANGASTKSAARDAAAVVARRSGYGAATGLAPQDAAAEHVRIWEPFWEWGMITREMLESLGAKYREPPPGVPVVRSISWNHPHASRAPMLPAHPGWEKLEVTRPRAPGEKTVLWVPKIR